MKYLTELKVFKEQYLKKYEDISNINILESEAKDIFKEFGLEWFIIENELPTEFTHIFLHPVGGYRIIVFDFGLSYTKLTDFEKNGLDDLYIKVKNIISKYNLPILEDVKYDDCFYVEAELQGEENITDIIRKYKKIYHLTLEKYIPSIIKDGLTSISKSPDLKRIYEYDKLHFTTNPYNEQERHLLYDFIMKQKDKNDKPILLEIDIEGLDIKFYLDKDAWQSPDNDVYNFWSNSNITKERIKIVS